MHHVLRKNAFAFLFAVPMMDVKPGVIILHINDHFRSDTKRFSN